MNMLEHVMDMFYIDFGNVLYRFWNDFDSFLTCFGHNMKLVHKAKNQSRNIQIQVAISHQEIISGIQNYVKK